MTKFIKSALLCIAFAAVSGAASAQTYLKLNCLYAVVGVINPSLEMTLSPHSTMSLDVTYSPWRSVNGAHLHFGLFTGEYRYYFKQSGNGWYVSGNIGMTGFDISKPIFMHRKTVLAFKEGYSKGFGLMMGIGFGYQHVFRERWVVDAFIAGDWFCSWYNGYFPNGAINMEPNGHENYVHPDPFNGSGEILPAKLGVSIGYRIISPDRQKRKK